VLENSTRNASTMSVKMLTKGVKKGSAAGSVIRTQVRSKLRIHPLKLQEQKAVIAGMHLCNVVQTTAFFPLQIPYIRADIPILILFRALGFVVSSCLRLKTVKFC